MRVVIRARGISHEQLARERVRRSVLIALSRFAPRIRSVSVTVREEGEARPGTQYRCRLRVALKRGGDPVLAEDLDGALPTAIDRCADRMRRNVRRALDQTVEIRRRAR